MHQRQQNLMRTLWERLPAQRQQKFISDKLFYYLLLSICYNLEFKTKNWLFVFMYLLVGENVAAGATKVFKFP